MVKFVKLRITAINKTTVSNQNSFGTLVSIVLYNKFFVHNKFSQKGVTFCLNFSVVLENYNNESIK